MTTISVGPGGQYAELHEVPWETIGANTTVLVAYRPEPYRSFVPIYQSDTRIIGIDSPGGDRPRITGDMAVLRPNTLSKYQASFGLVQVLQHPADWRGSPKNVTIENLQIERASPEYTSDDGAPYDAGAAGIRIQRGSVLVRDCEVTGCGNGIFSRSFADRSFEGTSTTLEGCWVHDNNLARVPGVHNAYLQDAFGTTVKACRFGWSGGSSLKVRSDWCSVAYSMFGAVEAIALDLVEPEDHAETAFMGEDLVYGNLIEGDVYRQSQTLPLNYGMDHFGIRRSDGTLVQRQRLKFAWNTVLLRLREQAWTAQFLRPSTVQQNVLFSNNVLAIDNRGLGIDGGIDLLAYGERREGFEQGGTLDWGNNALPNRWRINAAAKEPDRGFLLGPDGELGRHRSRGAAFIAEAAVNASWRAMPVVPATVGVAPRPEWQFNPLGPMLRPLQCIESRFGTSACGARE